MWWILIVLVALFFIFFKFTIGKEGTAKVVMRLGGVKKVILVWKGYRLDENWNVVSVPSVVLLRLLGGLGGLRFVGIRWLDKVYSYNFRWRDIQLVAGEEKAEFHEKVLDHIFVRPDVYWTDIKGAETKPDERIPLDIQFLVTMRVTNPYKALFKAPSNWNENVMARLNASFTTWVGTKALDEILDIRQDRQKIWDELKKDPLVKMLEDEWGIQIEDKGIEIRVIGMPPEYQEAAGLKRKVELQAEAKRRQFGIEAEARAAEVMGTVIESVVTGGGKPRKEVQEEFQKDPRAFYKKHKVLIDNIMSKLSWEERAGLRIETPGAVGVLGDFLRLAAAWQRMPSGKSEQEKRERKMDRVEEVIKEEGLEK